MNESDMEAVVLSETERLVREDWRFPFELDATGVLCLVAQLQLATRHPRNTGTSADWARGFVAGLVRQVEEISPSLAESLRLGDDPQYDRPFH